MILLLEKLLQSSKTGIALLLAITRAFVQVFTASAAKSFAIFLAQHLGIHIQHENSADNVFKICKLCGA